MAKTIPNSIVINKYKWVKPTYSLIYKSDITLLKIQLHFFNLTNLVLDFIWEYQSKNNQLNAENEGRRVRTCPADSLRH